MTTQSEPGTIRRYDGPVEVAFSLTDPGDMGEPREFTEGDVTYLVVPDVSLWAAEARETALRRQIDAMYIGGHPLRYADDNQVCWSGPVTKRWATTPGADITVVEIVEERS